jgi:hypothetical protein
MRYTALILVLAFAGCAPITERVDQSLSLKPATSLPIVWHRASKNEVNSAYMQIHGKSKELGHLEGFFYVDKGICHIYAPDLDNADALDTLGHEVKHCFDGLWHGSKTELGETSQFYNVRTKW